MKYIEAKDALPKFERLKGKPTNDSIILDVYISYIEPALAQQHLENWKLKIADKRLSKYENDYTLWALLDNGTILPVKQIIFQERIEDLLESARLLD